MQIKVFRGMVTAANDINNIEQQVNEFIVGRTVIDIKQSLSPSMVQGGTRSHMLVITVLYK